jgi:hypothetical protein
LKTQKTTLRIMQDWVQDVREQQAAQAAGPALDVNAATQELRTKDRNTIEMETALNWASRAIASYNLSIQSPDPTAKTLRFTEGDDFATEAREHASLVQDKGKLLKYVIAEIEKVRPSALSGVVTPPS